MDTKVCTKCGIEKPLDQFYKDRTRKDWYWCHCKSCKRVTEKKYRDKNSDIIKQKRKEYKRTHQDKIKKYNYDYYHNNKETELKRSKQYRIDNPDYDKERYWKHRDKCLNSVKKLQQEKKYQKLHTKTYNYIKKYNLYPDNCIVCWSNKNIEAHHPDYNKWYEIIFVCHRCHTNIHAWNIECPEPIDLLLMI